MTEDKNKSGWASWLASPSGAYLLAWEQAQFDAVVADLFGFHAIQAGLPCIDTLRSNRMPQRWLADFSPEADLNSWGLEPRPESEPDSNLKVSLYCDAESLPFPDGCLDLIVMPHTLELAEDAHRALAEAVRVLRPEGHLVISGLNPMSLWGGRHTLAERLGRRRDAPGFLPSQGDMIGYWRLRDWLRLLDLDIEQAHLGCYRPPFRSAAWLSRFEWLEAVGQRWWPVLGAVYLLVAVKRVRGMRLIGMARSAPQQARAARRAVASREGQALAERPFEQDVQGQERR